MIKDINYRIENLELRRTTNQDYNYLEIVRWVKDVFKPCCYTIAIFRNNNEGYDFESVGDRILMPDTEWSEFKILIEAGFNHLSKEALDIKEEKENKFGDYFIENGFIYGEDRRSIALSNEDFDNLEKAIKEAKRG